MFEAPAAALDPNLTPQEEARMKRKGDASPDTSLDKRHPKRWPLLIIAAPAAVAVWSGWVGLGADCGFGLVQPLPGIVPWHLNTAITLPIGVEAYATFALGAYLHPATPARARTFARNSAIGALVLGMFGQIAYHLLAAAHRTRAPWPVVVFVACLPIAVVGFGTMLTHLLRSVPAAEEAGPAMYPAVPEPPVPPREPPPPDASMDSLLTWLTSGGNEIEAVPELHRRAGTEFAAEVLSGQLPGIRDIRGRLQIGQDKAAQVQAHLRALLPGTDGAS